MVSNIDVSLKTVTEYTDIKTLYCLWGPIRFNKLLYIE